MSLYCKHRPQKFIDLVGQDHIKTTLANALQSGKFAHAYLFYGPKGSGKTTTARLLAKALNCTGRPLAEGSFEPCNRCISCKEIIAGASMDVIEIDAASNRGIDEIRNLREKIRFAPTAGKYKVYVIDECHMLTKEAFNALLKTLEEPPAHAIFVFATTELHKVPSTILSRTQVFDFKKAKHGEICAKLQKIVKAEKIAIEEEALNLIGRLAFGAFRDAETMLDQVASLGRADEKITLSQVQAILGQTTQEEVWRFIEYLASKNRTKALKLVEEIYFEGKDLENFISETVGILRQAILAKSGLEEELALTEEENQKIRLLAETLSNEEIIAMMEKLIGVAGKVKTSVLGQLPLEIAVFELTKEDKQDNLDNQDKQEKQVVNQSLQSEPVVIKENRQRKTDNGKLANSWPSIIQSAKTHSHPLAALLKEAVFSGTDDGTVIIAVKYKLHADQICRQKNRKIIEEAILKTVGTDYKVECVIDSNLKTARPADHDEELLQSAQEIFEVE